MRKVLMILLTGIFIAGCGSNDANENENANSTGNDTQAEETTNESNDETDNEDIDVYQIGETAEIKTAQGDYPYELTVNDFELAKEYDGKPVRDFFHGGEVKDEDSLAIVNITMKNTGEDSFIPSNTTNAELIGDKTNEMAEDEFFTEREEELEPGEEITGDLVFFSGNLYDDGVVYLTYEIVSDYETEFELPIPEE